MPYEWEIAVEKIERHLQRIAECLERDCVRHGRWIVERDESVMHCDFCSWAYEYYDVLEEEWNYCPHCGAKMREVEEWLGE